MNDTNEQHRLSQNEVHDRLGGLAAKIPEASSIALALGQQLLQEVMDRSSQIDSKGISVLGWSAAVLVFLLVHASKIYRSGSLFLQVLGTIAMALAYFAALSGMLASRKRQFRGISDEIWFPDPEQMVDLEHLRQHYLAELHESRGSWDRICKGKADWLGLGQYCLAFAAFLVVLMLLYGQVELLAGFGPALASALGDA
jgi:hypothetical protein